MKQHWKQPLSLLLALCLSAALLVPAVQARETAVFDAFPEPVPLADRDWERADTAAFGQALAALDAAGADAPDQTLFALWTDLDEAYQRLETAYIFCTLDYYRDATAYGDAYMGWYSLINQAFNDYTAATQALLAGSCAPLLEEALGADADVYRDMLVDTPAQMAMLEEQTALVNDYWQAITQDYRAVWNGRSFTEDAAAEAYLDGTLSDEAYGAITAEIAKARNAAAAPILAELVPLRNRYAASHGYDSYAAFAYEKIYDRDYAPADTAALYQAVKEIFVPLSRELNAVLFYRPSLDGSLLDGMTDLTQEEVLDLAAPCVEQISSEYAAVYAYMRDQDLCDIGPLDTKSSVGFTNALPAYGSAYLFNRPMGIYWDVKVLIHEFGHYADAALGPNTVLCFDTAEICSQGLELLTLPFAAQLAGAAGADAYRAAELLDMIDGVISGCLEDEFQQAVYADGGMTVPEMNRLYRQLAAEYGYQYDSPGDQAYNWVQISHTFESPFYYISYATSALSSLELLGRSLTDFDGAVDTYLSLVAQTETRGYLAALEEAGLSNPLRPDAVEQIAADTLRYLEQTLYHLPAWDLSGNWAAEAVRLCTAAGLFQGDEPFRAEAPLTQEALAALLHRLAGSPETESSPLSWAAEEALMDPAALAEPGRAVTRQELAQSLFRLFGEASSGAAPDFADWDQTAPEAAPALAWAVEAGLFQGDGAGLLRPGQPATWGATAAVLYRWMMG